MYKRQVMNVMKMLESKLYTNVPSMYGNTWADMPVSYTHLDVYKRQD